MLDLPTLKGKLNRLFFFWTDCTITNVINQLKTVVINECSTKSLLNLLACL